MPKWYILGWQVLLPSDNMSTLIVALAVAWELGSFSLVGRSLRGVTKSYAGSPSLIYLSAVLKSGEGIWLSMFLTFLSHLLQTDMG